MRNAFTHEADYTFPKGSDTIDEPNRSPRKTNILPSRPDKQRQEKPERRKSWSNRNLHRRSTWRKPRRRKSRKTHLGSIRGKSQRSSNERLRRIVQKTRHNLRPV